VRELRESPVAELVEIANELSINGAGKLRKRDLVFQILRARIANNGTLLSEGVLEVLPDGFGFLRGPEASYLPGQDDVYVSPSQIRKFDLRTGDTILGQIRPPKDGERYFALIKVESINFEAPESLQRMAFYDNLTPLHPNGKFDLELGSNGELSRPCSCKALLRPLRAITPMSCFSSC
jgi:transcription termination factor Rho